LRRTALTGLVRKADKVSVEMPWRDIIQISLENLRQAKVRLTLTCVGVVIAIATLVAMVSFGAGLRRETIGNLETAQFLTTFRVLGPRQTQQLHRWQEESETDRRTEARIPLNDGLVTRISALEGVDSAVPEIRLPVQLQKGDRSFLVWVRGAVPAMGNVSPFSRIESGRFLQTSAGREIVLSHGAAKALGFKSPSQAVGTTLELLVDQIRPARSEDDLPFETVREEYRVVGVTPLLPATRGGSFNRGTVIPLEEARRLWLRSPSSVSLRGDNLTVPERRQDYDAIEVRVLQPADLERVRRQVESLGAVTFAISDEMERIKQAFLILQVVLSVLGAIAMVVASLGIANVLVMSVLERVQMIGIMKAIGGRDSDIRRIFLVEAGSIGFLGGLLGVACGWLLTRVAHFFLARYFERRELAEIPDLFAYPIWLLLGAVAFAVLFSVASGLIPANRAARIDPVQALRRA
jgi:putative ABC transport system permease protein